MGWSRLESAYLSLSADIHNVLPPENVPEGEISSMFQGIQSVISRLPLRLLWGLFIVF